MTFNSTDTPPADLLRAIEEFNRENWFSCHEILEALWREEVGEIRDFYQGLIKIAAALHHWRNGNYVGSIRLLDGGSSLLRQVRPTCQGASLLPFISAVDTLRKTLSDLGPERMNELPHDLLPTLQISVGGRKKPEA